MEQLTQIAKRGCRAELATLCRLLYERHLVSGVGGNVSMRFEDGFLVTPSGICLRDVTAETLLHVSATGAETPVTTADAPLPSKELNAHLAIFEVRPEVNVVCHVHGAPIVAVSCLFPPGPDSMPPLTPGFAYFTYPLPLVPYYIPGTAELAAAHRKGFANGKTRALLLQNHGLTVVGASCIEAMNMAEEVQENAEVYILTAGKASHIPEKMVVRG